MANVSSDDNSMAEKLQSWLSELPTTPPTANMMRWMSSYDFTCNRSCCYSPDCACIRCDECYKSLTSPHLRDRYVCSECDLGMSEDLNRFCFEVPGLTLCESCFNSHSFKHEHTLFCRIEENGHHSGEIRRVGISSKQQLQLSDLVALPMERISSKCGECCQACLCPFEESDPPVSLPGCENAHGLAVFNDKYGVQDSNTFMCRECAFQCLSVNGQGTYCDLSHYCKVCMHTRESLQWREEFASLATEAYEDGGAASLESKLQQQLMLHRQKWIQQIMREEFELKRDRMSGDS